MKKKDSKGSRNVVKWGIKECKKLSWLKKWVTEVCKIKTKLHSLNQLQANYK